MKCKKLKNILLILFFIIFFQTEIYSTEFAYTEKKIDNYKIGLITNIPGAVYSVGVDNNNNIYATDFTNGYIYRFTIKDRKLDYSLINLDLKTNQLIFENISFSEIKKKPGNFVKPHFVNFDKNENIAIVESGTSPKADPKNPTAGKVREFNLNSGKFINEYKVPEIESFKLDYPNDKYGWDFPVAITYDDQGNSYITEFRAHKISKFEKNRFTGLIGYKNNNKEQELFYTDGKFKKEHRFGGLAFPHTLRVGPDKNIYIADTVNDRILKYSFEGKYLGWVGKSENGNITDTWTKEGKPIAGNDLGAFDDPIDIFFMDDESMLVSDKNNNRLVLINLNGKSRYWLGKRKKIIQNDKNENWKNNGEPVASNGFIGFESPFNFVFKNDNLYVADRNNNRIKIIYNIKNLKYEKK